MASTVTVMSSPIFTDSPGRLVRTSIGAHPPDLCDFPARARLEVARGVALHAVMRTSLNTPLHSGGQRMSCGEPVWNLCIPVLRCDRPSGGSPGPSAHRSRSHPVLHGRPRALSAPCARARAALHQETGLLLRPVLGASDLWLRRLP